MGSIYATGRQQLLRADYSELLAELIPYQVLTAVAAIE
jgi:hypothetical protein